MAVIEKIAGVKEVALFGKGIHIVVENADSAVGMIKQTLMDHDIKVSRIEKIIPSLEDVFVSLIEARDRLEQPQSEVRV